MPAEWEPHQGTWFTWPRAGGISFPDRYEVVPPIYCRLIGELIAHEEVYLNVWDTAQEEEVRGHLRKNGIATEQISFFHFPAYEPWCRDHGPIFLVKRAQGEGGAGGPQSDAPRRAVVDWGYNAWGGKYPPFDLDDAIPRHVAEVRGLPLFTGPMVLEGGSIEVNGSGTLLTTEACLLHPNRNPGLTRAEIEQNLRDYLGVTNILWLGEGIVGDDTDGHIDDLARFVNRTTVVTVVEADPADANYALLQDNLRRLRSMRTETGQALRIVELPLPGVVEYQGQRLPASYANFYIANNIVLVPTYGHTNDARALAILQREFPARRVIGLDSTGLIWGLGSFHCISQQEPAG